LAPPHPIACRTLKDSDAASAHSDPAQPLSCGAIGATARWQKDQVFVTWIERSNVCNKRLSGMSRRPLGVEGNNIRAAGEFEFLRKDRDRLLYAINLGLLSF
jgi:hypothetical protein